MLDIPDLDGRLAVTYEQLTAAGDELSRVLARIQQRDITAAQFAELVEWAGHLRISRGLSPNTGANYLEGVALFAEWAKAAQKGLEDVSGLDVEHWQQDLYLQHGESPSTRNVKLTAVRQFFAWRESQGRGYNPARSVPGPRRAKLMPRKYSLKQIERLLAAMDAQTPQAIRDRTILLFFLYTGARREEVVTLRLQQIELRQKVGAVRFFGKGAKERAVSFGGALVDAMHTWLATRDSLRIIDHDAVFVTLRKDAGRQIGSGGLDGVLRRAHKRAGLAMEPGKALHKLRSTYATALYDAGHDVRAVQIAMGHNDINTTMQYIAISNRQLRTRLPGDYFTGGTL